MKPSVSAFLLAASLAAMPCVAQAADCSLAVTRLIASATHRPVAAIEAATELGELGDESAQMDIVAGIEEKFGFEISDDDAEKIVTVADLIAVANKQARKGCP
jgi:acyl carrier protein